MPGGTTWRTGASTGRSPALCRITAERPLRVLHAPNHRAIKGTAIVEEAHKLLNREMAAQTAFSTIAREMRKYYVTLLIVDQRPSQIYDEVMSQLGTRISGWLGDEADIAAVLSGLAGRDSLRGMQLLGIEAGEAAHAGAEIIAFPEMCLTGYWHVRNLTRDAFTALVDQIWPCGCGLLHPINCPLFSKTCT